jgi:hypothetical protein
MYRKVEWEIVKDGKIMLPNGDIVIIERCYDKANKNIEVVHIRKYGRTGRRGFTLGKNSIGEFIKVLQEVVKD